MQDFQERVDFLIVGAGMTGLAAADALQRSGRRALVVDKGRGLGGRLANRRIGGATFDHGAQFITARSSRFAALVDQWSASDVLEAWHRGPAGSAAERIRWRGKPAMTAVAKALARSVETRLAQRVVSLSRDAAGWAAACAGGETILANTVLLTPPVPQSLALLEAGGVTLAPATRARLEAIEYERCLAVMAVLDGPSRIPPPGGFAPPAGPIAWIADNQAKGVSAEPAVTIHATAAFSLAHWDRDRAESGRALLDAAAPWLGSGVTECQVHGWRYSKPLGVEPEPCLVLSRSPRLILAGDAFSGPRVEGAVLSGWAAADRLSR